MKTPALAILVLVSFAAQAQVAATESVAMTVADLERSVAFFRNVLQFAPGASFTEENGGARTKSARMTLGDEAIELTEHVSSRGRPFPADARSNDRSFQHVAIVVRDMQKAFAALRAGKVELITSEPQRLPDWNPKAGGIEALYFRDPDGHPLEIIRFPAGKGDPKWQRPTDRLFLGIDHTAIVVADTGAALVFYRDLLGMKVVGGSENWGPEQERLNAVPGARLRITTLRAAAGIGVELLEYVAPSGGRPMPYDERQSDVLHRETVMRLGTGAGGRPILVRDPDGHAIRLIPPPQSSDNEMRKTR